jgi:NAD(P)-dependent dehydrogenase (short-subunit alcohol dehydrogenase family)
MLEDRVAIVTGAGQGIGRAIAVELARAGAHVVTGGRRLEPVEAVAGEVRALGRRALAFSCDVREATQVERVVAETVREFGRVDLLVNNAGYRIRAPLDQLPRREWDAMVGTNLTGVFLCCQAVARVMIPRRAGKIINITSVAGRTGSRGMAAYAAAKAGVTALTQSLGAEWAKYGITVNAVAPGLTATEGVMASPHKEAFEFVQMLQCIPRRGEASDIAPAVAFLASEEAGWVTGQLLVADGGMSHN